MGKYFGTDGIRGMVGTELTAQLAGRVGFALGTLLGEQNERPHVFIGRDTRISGSMLSAALCAGLHAAGADASLLGVVPTPAVALLTARDDSVAAGVMISASHNPYYDNGIKIFGPQGFKLTDEQEARLESLLDSDALPAPKLAGQVGVTKAHPGEVAAQLYANYVLAAAETRLDGMRLLIDCAHGSASATAQSIFPALGAECVFMGSTPDGININEACGSTHMEALQTHVRAGHFDLGLAFDGDADRFLAVDADGQLIDGDRIMGALAGYMQGKGTLKGPLVGTIVSNLGLQDFLRQRGIDFIAAQVGDRHVLEAMRRNGCNLGGEQSGHVILLDQATTGDGQMTAVCLLTAMRELGLTAAELCGQIALYPQKTVNIPVANELKGRVAGLAGVQQAEQAVEAAFGRQGRVIIRPSGTEPKVRVMVEGPDLPQVEALAQSASQAILKELGTL